MPSNQSLAGLLCTIGFVLWTAVGSAAAEDAKGWRADLMARAPVASPDSIPKGSSLWRAHERGKLIYGGGKTQKLFSVENPLTGELEGFDATIALLLAKYLTGGANVQTVVVTTATREGLLQNGSVDAVIFTYGITDPRKKVVDFAGPYFLSNETIATLEKSPKIDTIEELAGKSVCGTKGGNMVREIQARSIPTASLLTVDTSTECEAMLRAGRVDAEVQTRPVLLGQFERGGLYLSPNNYGTADFGIGLPKGDPAVIAFLDHWIAEIVKSGIWSEAFKNTIGRVPLARESDFIPSIPK